ISVVRRVLDFPLPARLAVVAPTRQARVVAVMKLGSGQRRARGRDGEKDVQEIDNRQTREQRQWQETPNDRVLRAEYCVPSTRLLQRHAGWSTIHCAPDTGECLAGQYAKG